MKIRDALGAIIDIDLATGAHPAFPITDALGNVVVIPANPGGINIEAVTEAAQRKPVQSWPGYGLIDDAGAGTLLARFGATGAVVADLATGYIGVRSLKVTTDGTANFTDVRATLATPLNLTGRIPVLAIRCADPSRVEELQLTLGTGGLTNFRRWQAIEGNQGNKWLATTEWQLVSLPWADGADTLAPDRANITHLQVRARSSGLGATDIWIGGIFFASQLSRAIGTVSFDDGYASVYTRAWPVMRPRGIRSTVYCPAEYVGAAGRLTLPQIREMVNSGLVEIGYHGTGNDQRTLTQIQVRELIEKDLAKWALWRIPIRTAAYPGGEEDATTDGVKLRDIYADYFESARMIFQGQAETVPAADRLRLRVSSYVTNATTTAAVLASINGQGAHGGWHHQVYHDIVASGASQTTEYNLADFTTNMNNLAASALAKLTVTEALG